MVPSPLLASSAGPVSSFVDALPLPSMPSSMLQWTVGVSPLSTHTEVVSALAVYLAVIFGGQYLMQDRKAFRKSCFFEGRGCGALCVSRAACLVCLIGSERGGGTSIGWTFFRAGAAATPRRARKGRASSARAPGCIHCIHAQRKTSPDDEEDSHTERVLCCAPFVQTPSAATTATTAGPCRAQPTDHRLTRRRPSIRVHACLGLGEVREAIFALTQFKWLFMLHNFLLSAGSGLVLALMLEEIIPILYQHGFFYAICHTSAWTSRLETYYIINYYFKYWELADTVFLVVKKKPLQFLHVFHHTATAALCYTQLNGRTSVSWVPIVANLTVHVLMYYYYLMTAAGYKIWWKKYLTTLQITQFVVDLFVVYFASYSYFAVEYFPSFPTYGSCAGTEGAAALGCCLLTSYLFLFIAFYKKTYNQQAAKKNALLAAKKVAAVPTRNIAEFKKKN
ncbi:BQ2448_566 [Microbotryum intermedium]|uniref:Elongation of fatty acids protein n=1 Tax=Microbotryum intermedium TaxID=269621 RepID=A0A238F5P0_9BASI|nr:BQ2448_566 [Microbotryum intermedium]